MACILSCGLLTVGMAVIGYAVYNYVTKEMMRRKLERWNNTSKDVVILHGYPRGRTIISFSPWLLKLETYLRLTNIKYQLEYKKDIFGPKGKTPWISLNGKHLGDSEFIMDFLNKKFEKNLDSKVTNASTLANARIIRVMLEEFLIWAVGMERMEYASLSSMRKVFGNSILGIPTSLFMYLRPLVKGRAYSQGIGRHSQEEVVFLMTKYLKDVSVALGDKKYFGGDELCQEDCGIFGILGQYLWACPDSPYEALMNGECKNLKDYCLRIKEQVWPDWEQQLAK